jgi:3'-phosphoadenosine 5'-phosphosulfate sulfotransferase (PAPS reductase)/FAD synthetase
MLKSDRWAHIKACVQYSGGLMSWGAAKLAVDKYGPENVLLLFADVGVESDGTYRFILQGANALGAELKLVRANPGGPYLTPWDICAKYNFLPNWKFPLCSTELKKTPLKKFIKDYIPEGADIVIGFSIEEEHRINKMLRAQEKGQYRKYNLWFPLADKPYTPVCRIREWLKQYGIEESDLYKVGANHANCNGACFQASKGHWAWLLKEKPDVYAYYEEKESHFVEESGTTIQRKNGEPYSLKQLREDVEAGILKASYSRLPCACGVVWYQEEMRLTDDD